MTRLIAVDHGDVERRKAGRTFDLGETFGYQLRDEGRAQPFGVHPQRHEAGHPITRREREPQLRQEIGRAPVELRLEHRDRPLRRCHRLELVQQQLRFRRVGGEPARAAIEREQIVAVLGGRVRPDVEAVDERFGVEPLAERVLDERQIERLGLVLENLQQDFGARRAQRGLQIVGDGVGRLLAQLPQHDRRGLTEVRQRSELEIEHDRDRNGDGDREFRRQPQAAIAHAGGRSRTVRRLSRLACPQVGDPSVQAYSDLVISAPMRSRNGRCGSSAGCRVSSACVTS